VILDKLERQDLPEILVLVEREVTLDPVDCLEQPVSQVRKDREGYRVQPVRLD